MSEIVSNQSGDDPSKRVNFGSPSTKYKNNHKITVSKN